MYRKSLEGKERDEYERKRKIREALEGRMGTTKLYAWQICLLAASQHTARKSLANSFQQVSKRPAENFHIGVAAEGKPIPTELRKEANALKRKIDLEDDNTAVPRSHIDDEYAHAEERDPKILVTTSRDPSTRLVQFAKEMKLVLPNAQRINRGGQVCAHSAMHSLPMARPS